MTRAHELKDSTLYIPEERLHVIYLTDSGSTHALKALDLAVGLSTALTLLLMLLFFQPRQR
jgi:hypothetical protein